MKPGESIAGHVCQCAEPVFHTGPPPLTAADHVALRHLRERLVALLNCTHKDEHTMIGTVLSRRDAEAWLAAFDKATGGRFR